MSDDSEDKGTTIIVHSARFGDLTVPADSIIQFPTGLIGFPNQHRYVLIDHKPPFSWLHCVEDPNLAFVVVDGAEFGPSYEVKPPKNDPHCDFRAEDEFAILVIITVRPDPRLTTANLKAPLFVNIRNRMGVQVIFDDQRFSTRFPLWSADEKEEKAKESSPKKEK